eukprot:363354-Chlamydomonas_euryale.AAC.7
MATLGPSRWPEGRPAPPVLPLAGTTKARIAFSVLDVAAADLFISQWCRLRGTGIVLSKVLMTKEQLEHTALWPQFEQALTRGCKALFKRSRLFVDGAHVCVT